jgi:hypothetical protein
MKKFIAIALIVLAGCSSVPSSYVDPTIERDIVEVLYETARALYYEPLQDPNAKNTYVGEDEISAQCGDYSLYFVLRWNETHRGSTAYLCLSAQPAHFPDGLYTPFFIEDNDLTIAHNSHGVGFSYAPNHIFYSTLGTYLLLKEHDESYRLWLGHGSTTHVWVVIVSEDWIGVVEPTGFDNGGELSRMYGLRRAR